MEGEFYGSVRRLSSLFIMFVLILVVTNPTTSLRFDLPSGNTKCISEDIKNNAMSVGKYSVINPAATEDHGVIDNSQKTPLPDSHRITARVTSPYGNNVHYADRVDSGTFSFTSKEDGDYMACFWAPDHKPAVTLTVDFDWKSGIAAKDWSSVAKKGQIDVMETELKKMEDTIKSIHDEMFYLREREEQMQELNKSTNSRMAWLSFLSLGICLSVAGLQIWHLKTFFNYALYDGNEEGTVEYCIKRRIMEYLNVLESDYGMVFTASRGSAFKLLADSYPFQTNKQLLTMYDHDSQSVNWMKSRAKEKGAHVSNAWFKWPTLKVCSSHLTKQISSAGKRKRGKKDSAVGLFAFPVQSRVTGTKYSYQWMSLAQKNNWHVLLDAGSLGPNDMDSLGLSLFRPDFIITSFYRVFGSDPTGFGCLLIRKSAIPALGKENGGIGSGMVKIIPVDSPYTGGLSDDVDELDNEVVMNEDDGTEDSKTANETHHRRESEMPAFSGAYTSAEVMEVYETEERDRVNYYGGSEWNGSNAAFEETDDFSVGEIMKSPVFSDEDETDDATFWINLGHSPGGSPADTRPSDDANPPTWFATRKGHAITSSHPTPKPDDGPLSFDSAVLSISQISNHTNDHFGRKDPEEFPDPQTSDLHRRNTNNSNTFGEIEEIVPDDDRENATIRREQDGGEFRLLDGREGTTSAVNRFFASEENDRSRSMRHRVSFVTEENRSNSGGSMASDTNSANAAAETSSGSRTETELTCRHLDHVTMMGLNKTTLRLRYLTNWLVTSLLQLRIPDPTGEENDHVPLVCIYGPKIKYERGCSLALNIKDRRQPSGVVINPETVQNLAEKNGISLGVGFLSHVEIPDTARAIHGGGSGNSGGVVDLNHHHQQQQQQQKRRKSNKRRDFGSPIRIQVVTASLGFLTNFKDVHSLWSFVAKFLNPSFAAEPTVGSKLSTIVEASDV